MKPVFYLSVFLAAASVLQASDTAYSALRAFGKKEGESSLHQVIELHGRNGTPQPSTWKLVVNDSKARGGIREIEVHGGKISSERTPISRDTGAPMNFNQLNLDSDGAFTVANQEAEKRGVPFDHIDYSLQSGSGAGAPVWTLELNDGHKGLVGVIRVAADTGAIVDTDFSGNHHQEDQRYVESDHHHYVDGDHHDYADDRTSDDRDVGQKIGDFFKRVGRHFERRGKQVSNFFTGKSSDD